MKIVTNGLRLTNNKKHWKWRQRKEKEKRNVNYIRLTPNYFHLADSVAQIVISCTVKK